MVWTHKKIKKKEELTYTLWTTKKSECDHAIPFLVSPQCGNAGAVTDCRVASPAFLFFYLFFGHHRLAAAPIWWPIRKDKEEKSATRTLTQRGPSCPFSLISFSGWSTSVWVLTRSGECVNKHAQRMKSGHKVTLRVSSHIPFPFLFFLSSRIFIIFVRERKKREKGKACP